MLAFGFRQLIGLFIWGEQSDYPCCTFLIQSVSQQQMGWIEDTIGIVHLTGGEHPRALGPPASVLFREADEWSPLPSVYRPM